MLRYQEGQDWRVKCKNELRIIVPQNDTDQDNSTLRVSLVPRKKVRKVIEGGFYVISRAMTKFYPPSNHPGALGP